MHIFLIEFIISSQIYLFSYFLLLSLLHEVNSLIILWSFQLAVQAKSVILKQFVIEYSFMQLQQSRLISPNYSILESQLLGKGSTGNVYLGLNLCNQNRRLAIKAIDLNEIDNEVTKYLLSCEIAALKHLNKNDHHFYQHIVKLEDVIVQGNFIYLVTQLLEGGTLADYIKKFPNGIPQEDVAIIFRQILEGYSLMRNNKIIHRDLKPDNMLFKSKPEISKKIAIIDFGYCEMEEVPNKPQMFYNVGSPKYMAPEAYQDNFYSEKSDIWALGVILYEMLVGKTCDQGMNMESYLEMIKKNGIPLPNHLNPFYKKILSAMLNYNFKNRYDIFQILKDFDDYHPQRETLRNQGFRGPQYLNINDLMLLKAQNKTNPVFRSTMIEGAKPPQFLMNSQIYRNDRQMVIQQSIQKQRNRKIEKSINSRNGPQIIFNLAKNCQPLLTHTQNIDLNRNLIQNQQFGERNAEIKVNLNDNKFLPMKTLQNGIKMQNQFQKNIHFNQTNVIHRQQKIHPYQIDQNRMKMVNTAPFSPKNIKNHNYRNISVEKAMEIPRFQSPENKNYQANKIQFMTDKSIKHNVPEPQLIRKVINTRTFNGDFKQNQVAGPLFYTAMNEHQNHPVQLIFRHEISN